jgi:hypothetical protein
MSIFTKIISGRSDGQKNIFSLFVALVITASIITIWSPFKNTKNDNLEIQEEKKLSSISPVQMIKEEFSKALSSFQEVNLEEIPMDEVPVNNIPIEIIQSTSTEATTTSDIVSD